MSFTDVVENLISYGWRLFNTMLDFLTLITSDIKDIIPAEGWLNTLFQAVINIFPDIGNSSPIDLFLGAGLTIFIGVTIINWFIN